MNNNPGTEFLSLKEAADYLNEKYKTVYRLVREGTIPAAKIGSRYRIRKSDLEAFFEKQKVQTASPVQRCSVCGRPITSELSIGGYCKECGAPICFACWQWDHKRYCAEHDPEKKTKEAMVSFPLNLEKEPLRCGRCFKIIPDEESIGGRCEAEGCDRPICKECWNKPDGHWCLEHAPKHEEKIASARSALSAGVLKVLVTSVEARKRELNFINRFEYKVHRIGTIRNPVTGEVIRVDDWERYHKAEDETARLLDILGVGYVEKDLLARLPLNAVSRFVVPGREGRLILEAIVLSHIEAHARDGFDSAPMSLKDLMPVLERASKEAESTGDAYVVGIASTTGWDDEAKSFIASDSDGKSFAHRLVMPCLVDLESGKLIYNELDERLSALVPLFMPQMIEENVAQTGERVKAMFEESTSDSFSVDEIAKAIGVQKSTVEAAFKSLAKTGEFSLHEVDGFGLVIARE